MEANTNIIVCVRKEEQNNVTEHTLTAKCYQCNEDVIYDKLTYEEAQERVECDLIKFLCGNCFKEMPNVGKLMRPCLKRIKRMRNEGYEVDEISIRRMMKDIKNKDF